MSNDGVTEGDKESSATSFAGDTDGLSRIGGFLDRGDTGLIVVDDSFIVTSCNETAIDLLHLDDPVGSDVRGVAPIDEDVTSAIRQALRTAEIVDLETSIDGTRTLRIRAIPNDRGSEAAIELREIDDQVAMRRELRRSDRILETLDDGVYTLDDAFVITMVNDAVTEITGYEREELVGSHASMLAGAETLDMADELLEQLRGDGSDVGMIESSIRTADGERLPMETYFSTVQFASGRQQRVGILRDLTDRRRNERTLRELNRSARRLLRADTERVVYETTVDLVTTVWPNANVVAYAFDEVGTVLDAVAAAGDFPESRGPGSAVWEEFLTGEDGVTYRDVPATAERTDHGTPTTDHGMASDEPRERTERDSQGSPSERDETFDELRPSGRVVERSGENAASTRRTLYATLDEYGILQIELTHDATTENVEESLELLAANAVAALERVEQEAALSRQSDVLVERSRKLEELHELNDLLRRINGALVEADTLAEVADAVCELLVDAKSVTFAWFGETYLTGGTLDVVSKAGAGDGYLEDLGFIEIDDSDGSSTFETDAPSSQGGLPTSRGGASPSRMEPTYRALDDGETVVVDDVSVGLREASWRERALVRGYRSVISIPLSYDDLDYGMLTLYADERDAFDGEFGDLLAELGRTVANAINGIETRRSLRSESFVQLQLRVEAPDSLLVRIASALGESVRVDGTVPQEEDRSLLYVVSDAGFEPIRSTITAIESVRMLDDGDDSRAELTVTGTTIVDQLATLGANVDRVIGTPAGVETTVSLPRSTNVRSFVEALEERYVAVELLSRRNRTADDEPSSESSRVEETLTDRQLEAARTAYLAGYFEWPRASTGEEVAAAMGITQPTFNRHLRTTTRKLFSRLFARSDAEE